MNIQVYMANQLADYVRTMLVTVPDMDACAVFDSMVMGFVAAASRHEDPDKVLEHLVGHIEALRSDPSWLAEFDKSPLLN